LRLGVVVPLEPSQIPSQREPEAEVILLLADCLGQRLDGFLDVAEAGEYFGLPGQVLGVIVGPVGDFGPGGLGLVGSLEVVEVLAEVFVILGLFERGRWLSCRAPGHHRQSRPVATNRDLCRGHRVLGLA